MQSHYKRPRTTKVDNTEPRNIGFFLRNRTVSDAINTRGNFNSEIQTGVSGGVYVISVAARILSMHPQTLRKYERLGLVTPTRSVGMLRLYSAEDVVRVRLIKYMVDNLGMNLAGVEFALGLVNRIIHLRDKIKSITETHGASDLVIKELEKVLGELGYIFPDKSQE